MKNFTVRDLPRSERPRERLVKFGEKALSSIELLALILGRGVAGESVMALSQKLISCFGSLKGVINASLEDLMTIKGVGLAKASQIKAIAEIASRLEVQEKEISGKKLVSHPQDIFKLLKQKIRNFQKEHFFVICLNSRNEISAIEEVSVGTLNASLVHPREVFKTAINHHSAQIIIAHNHPSGSLEPSNDDLAITKKLIESGKIIGIEVIDHIIITKTGYLSFKKQGII